MMWGGMRHVLANIIILHYLGHLVCLHADKLLKQLVCEVRIFLSDWHVIDAEETGDIDDD